MRFRQNVAWMMAAQGVYALCQWAKLVVLARLGGPEIVGVFALALALATPIMMFSGLQMRQVLVADAAGTYPFKSYRTVRTWAVTLGCIALLAITLLAGYRGHAAAVIVVIGLAKAFESMSDVFYGLEQRHERLDLVAQSIMLRGAVSLVALALAYGASHDLLFGAMAMAAASGLVWLLFDRTVSRPWRNASDAQHRDGNRRLLKLALIGLPLGVTMLLVSLNVNVPRYFIEEVLSREDLGLFAAMAYFVTAGRMVIVAMCQPASPRLANHFALGDFIRFRELLLTVTAVSALLGLCGLFVAALFGEQLLTLFYGQMFAQRVDVFVWVMITALVNYAATPLGYGLTAMQRFNVQPVLFSVVVALNALGCALLVPNYGMLGAVWGWLGASLAQLLLTSVLTWRGLKRAGAVGTLQTVPTLDSPGQGPRPSPASQKSNNCRG
jgi:O-antigen/teichoic acid export membrane protein